MVTHILRKTVENSWVVEITHSFAFFAIVTTLLGVGLSLVDFLADGLKVKKDRSGKFLLCTAALGPPLVFSLLYPNIFVTALKYAGGFGAVILFGILPAMMVWFGRYRGHGWKLRLLPGGKGALAVVMAFAASIFFIQLANALYFNR